MELDLALMEAPDPLRISYGRERPPHGWTFDERAVAQAQARLALEQPVHLSLTNGRGGSSRGGVHRWGGEAHVITILRYLRAGRASWTLWHELAHAEQLEHQFGGDDRAFGRAYSADQGRYEREANALADHYSLDNVLTVTREQRAWEGI